MNAAEHIVQSFFWQAESPKKKESKHQRHYLTISNVIGGNGTEIDILAMSPNGKDRLRVESHVDVNWPLSPSYVEYLEKGCIGKKFIDDNHSQKLIHESFFGDKSYRKVLVVWKSPYDSGYPMPPELAKQKIEVWSITDLLQDLLETVGTHNFQDDILRLMSMLSAMLCVGSALRDLGCKPVSGSVNEVSTMDCIKAVAELTQKCAAKSGQKTVSGRHVKSALELMRDIGNGK